MPLNYLPLIIMVLGLAVMAVIIVTKKREGSSSREEFFKSSGWRYQKGSTAHLWGDDMEKSSLNFKLGGKEKGIDWTLCSYLYMEIEFKRNQPYSIFSAVIPDAPKGSCLLMPYGGPAGNKSETGGILGNIPLTVMANIWNIKREQLLYFKPFECSNPKLRGAFVAYATSADIFNQVITAENEYDLVSYTGGLKNFAQLPLFSYDFGKLDIKVTYTLEKTEDIKNFIDLGVKFAAGISR